MQPTGPFSEAPPSTSCLTCDGPLEPGQRIRCSLCVQSADLAINEANGKTVLPSDVARVRERLGKGE